MGKRSRTNNEWLMERTGLLIVYAWVLLAVGFFLLTAYDPTYLESAENYVSILAIIGGPALLIVTKILETWNQDKQQAVADYEAQMTHERAMNEIRVKHEADMQRNPLCQTESTLESSQVIILVDEITSLKKEIEDLKKKPRRNGSNGRSD